MIKCQNCGASDFIRIGGQKICTYCDSILATDKVSEISLNSDVQNLLNKMELDPANAATYAKLILDIDPTNQEIKKYLL